ncbi:hypothetical protein diail_9068 [Diaporthe ilicicola]|nr:hypothetical protein diail_9068 [Diaporthe ilicicola]
MPPPSPPVETLSREENRRKALAGVRAIFDRYGVLLVCLSYKLIQARSGPAFDNATMNDTVVLDASIGPPHDAAAAAAPAGVPGPDTGIKASCTTRLFVGKELGNYNGVMHGGAAGVIFDMLTTIALGPVARPGFWT